MTAVAIGFDTREPKGGLALFRIFDTVLPADKYDPLIPSHYQVGDRLTLEDLSIKVSEVAKIYPHIIYFIADTSDFPGWLS